MADKFKALEGGSVDDDLAAMKANLLGTPISAKSSLPPARKITDAIESELEELRKRARESDK